MTLDRDYFEYLLYLMRADTPDYERYVNLLSELYDIPFIYSHPMDENRVIDALDMRREYLFDHGYGVRKNRFMDRDVSVLEVLAALSRRIEIEVTGEPGDDHIEQWFWVMLGNLGLLSEDAIDDRGFIRNKVDIWMTRSYDKNGNGSAFPLRKTTTDQRENDLWYQGQLYLSENWSF